jgi:Ca-activated chloride channel family protein
MNRPQIEIIPQRQAVCSDIPITQDVLVRITPPAPQAQIRRPPLNLGLVLDRSGSMAARNKINFARAAAIFAVQQLLPTDRVSVTLFDSIVETIVPNAPAEDKGRLVELIQGIHPGDCTALHGGWVEGGKQVGRHFLAGGLNRVLLLSDGLANVGERDPNAIAADVGRLAREGISTTTMGVGDDYNEDLLEAMARSGGGNYYYIESPPQLPDIFQTELTELVATFGNTVSLRIEPQGGATLTDVLNDLDRLPGGEFQLPPLIAGMPVLVVVRLSIPPRPVGGAVCRFRLAWNAPGNPQRQEMSVALGLPAVSAAVWEMLAPAAEVEERAALLWIARCKKQATRCLELGDGEGARRLLKEARLFLEQAPATPEMEREAQALARIEAYLASGNGAKFRKHAKYESFLRGSSKPYDRT